MNALIYGFIFGMTLVNIYICFQIRKDRDLLFKGKLEREWDEAERLKGLNK